MWVILSTLMILIIGNITYTIISNKKERESVISFKESLDLADLPVITFTQGEEKINFLLDSGATLSTIDQAKANTLKSKLKDTLSRTTGIGGSINNIPNVEMNIYYKEKEFSEVFQVINMSEVFNNIKKSTGVSIHGILGTTFMQKYKYVLDFKEMIAYRRSTL